MKIFDVTDYSKISTKISRFEQMITCFLDTCVKPSLTVSSNVRDPLFPNGTLDSAKQRGMAKTARIYLSVDAFVANLCNVLVAFPTGALETISRSLAKDAAGLTTTIMSLKKEMQSRLIVNLVMDEVDSSVVPMSTELRTRPTTSGSSCFLSMPWQGWPPACFFTQPDHGQLQNGRAS